MHSVSSLGNALDYEEALQIGIEGSAVAFS